MRPGKLAGAIVAGAVVVGAWAALLGVLVVVNAAFGNGVLVLLMFASAVVLAAVFAAAVHVWSRRRFGEPFRWRVPLRTTSGFLFGAAAALAGLGGIYTWALVVPAVGLAGLGVRAMFQERVQTGDNGDRG